MSKLITVLFLSTFSLAALANSSSEFVKATDKVDSHQDYQEYMDKKIEKNIDKRSENIIKDIARDIKKY